MSTTRKALRGVATIPIIFVFGILTVAIGVGVTALALSEGFSAQGALQSSRALFYAETGARDALVRIARNKEYSCSTENCYTLDMVANGCSSGAGCVRVSVSAGTGSTTDPKIIQVEGQSGLNVRALRVDVYFDTTDYGKIASTTWTEVTQ